MSDSLRPLPRIEQAELDVIVQKHGMFRTARLGGVRAILAGGYVKVPGRGKGVIGTGPVGSATWTLDPSVYFAAIVGDATGASAPASLPDGGMNPAFDGHGLHMIAYPEVGN